MLRFPVKVNSITNLSDARYCAGMGVEFIGFSVSEKHARHLTSDKANSIIGWLAGVKVVSEAFFGEKPEQLIAQASGISASIIEVDASMYKSNSLLGFNLILRLNLNEWESVKNKIPEEALLHLMLEKSDLLSKEEIRHICESKPTLLNLSKLELPEIDSLLTYAHPYGVSLDGGNEISPGLSDFEFLAEVLEYLEA